MHGGGSDIDLVDTNREMKTEEMRWRVEADPNFSSLKQLFFKEKKHACKGRAVGSRV